ncbi:hypothetical protein FBQ88_03320 [Gammaproteobacteria bacterium PRO2]|nr:hypothetical protein [Gammaproteobacteria bacterium PRO2]
MAAGTLSRRAAAGEPVRILFLTPSLQSGGAERQLVQLLQQLDPQRYRMTLATIDMPGQDDGRGYRADVRALAHLRLVDLGRQGRFDVIGPLLRLRRLLREERIEILHPFLNLATMFALTGSWRSGIPVVASAIRSSRDPNLPGLQFRGGFRQPFPSPARELPRHRQRPGPGALHAAPGGGCTTARTVRPRAIPAAGGHGRHAFRIQGPRGFPRCGRARCREPPGYRLPRGRRRAEACRGGGLRGAARPRGERGVHRPLPRRRCADRDAGCGLPVHQLPYRRRGPAQRGDGSHGLWRAGGGHPRRWHARTHDRRRGGLYGRRQ